jgi:hypothetical protein
MVKRVLLGAISAAVLASAAPAQSVNPLVREAIKVAQTPYTDMVRVQVGINFFIAGPSDEGEEADKIRDRARRAVYQMAASECDLLMATIASACRLEAININVNRQRGPNMPEGYNTTGSLSFRIQLK